MGLVCLLAACNTGTKYQNGEPQTGISSTSSLQQTRDGDEASDKDTGGSSEYTTGSTIETGNTIENTDENTTDSSTGSSAGSSAVHPDDISKEVKQLVSKMSLDEKVGQLFIVGFKGKQANQELTDMVKKYHAGGIILFGNNISSADQMLTLTNSIKGLNRNNRAPLFLSIDEEGGRISRMPEQLEKLPSNKAVGEFNDEAVSQRIGEALSYELSAFGMNVDFAPVLDIFSNPQNTVIGDRAFGTEPEIVSRLGIRTMKAIQSGGVVSVVKHFPGHGDTVVDSHKGLPVVEYGMDRLDNFELKPFQAAIDNGADAVMCAHILMKSIDDQSPASMSKAVITDILRNKMGFEGIVISDDMTMGAITEHYQIGDAVVRSVSAGCDILLVCHGYENQLNAIKAVKKAVVDGNIPVTQLNEKVSRIIMLKRKYQMTDEPIPAVDVEGINQEIRGINITINQ